jgi:hypothetical protein
LKRSGFLRVSPDASRLTVKLRKCKSCRKEYVPRSSWQQVCSLECVLKLSADQQAKAAEDHAKAERKADKAKREKLKTRGDWMREAQQAFNAWVRERDRQAGYSCICCGEPLDWSGNNVDAGHYRSRGSAPHMRFVETNCWAQTKKCNRYGAGRAVDYRIGLVARIGLEAVEALEADQEPRKWSIAELQEIKQEYRAKLKKLKELQ